MSELVSREEANAILAERYPMETELRRFPLGDILAAVPGVDDRFQNHMARVIEGMNILLDQNYYRIVGSWATLPQAPDGADRLIGTWNRIFQPARNQEPYCRFKTIEDRNIFFRLLALYHDIGKSISLERHPTIGWHLIRDVERDRVVKELYPLLLGIDYAEWSTKLGKVSGRIDKIVEPSDRRLLELFEIAIHYHDYFGVLSTGEASLPLAVDIVPLMIVNPADLQEIFSTLMIFNLADLYGSVPRVSPKMVDIFCADWEILCETVERVGARRRDFLACLVGESQSPNNTIDRLWRLMHAGEEEADQELITVQAVDDTFRDVTFNNFDQFLKNFALFCKLDYCLGFKRKLTTEAKRSVNSPTAVLSGINRMISIIVALENRYGHLCRRNDGTWRRLGVQMAALTRKSQDGSSKIAETIAQLLLAPEGVGRAWAVGDCTVWFMED